jgi:hypothetical protein
MRSADDSNAAAPVPGKRRVGGISANSVKNNDKEPQHGS